MSDDISYQAWICPVCFDDHINPQWLTEHNRALTARAADELRRLSAWKAEALEVLSGWEPVWQALGEPGALGEPKPVSALDEVTRLRAEVARSQQLRQRIADLTDEWDALDPQTWDVHSTGVSAAYAAQYAIVTDLRVALGETQAADGDGAAS